MPKYTSITIIYNPISTGPSEDYAKQLYAIVSARHKNIDIKLQPTKRRGHAETLAYTAAKKSKNPLIISSSGDGGYHEVINGAMRAQTEGFQPICAVLPAGNANDHGKSLHQHNLVQAINGGNITTIDLLEVTISMGSSSKIRYAHSYVGLGLTPVAAVELNRHTLNSLKELWIVLITLHRYKPFEIERENKIRTLDSLVATNINRMAKVLKVAKNARPDDGLFEVVVFPHKNKLKLITKLLKASTGGLHPKRHYQDYGFKVLNKMPVQLDGEVVILKKGCHVNIQCKKQILRTIL